MLEKSNTWPEQVLDTLNSCWRALLESLSNTQANVRTQPLPRRTRGRGLAPNRHAIWMTWTATAISIAVAASASDLRVSMPRNAAWIVTSAAIFALVASWAGRP